MPLNRPYPVLHSVAAALVSIAALAQAPLSAAPADPYEAEIDSLVSQMTLAEKLKMLRATSSFTSGGVGRLGVPEIVMSDGPHGVRFEHGHDWTPDEFAEDRSTYLPVAICLASTWDAELGLEYGRVLGSESRYRNKDIILGPGVNIIRSPLNGRNFEYLSEDPYLTAQMAVGYVRGVQEFDVATCVKHFIANNQETRRREVDVQLSDRAFHEIYLPGFKAAIEEGDAYSVMGAYNLVRGEHATQSRWLVDDILRGLLDYEGVYVSDWGSVTDSEAVLKHGVDIEMGTELMQEGGGRNYEDFYIVKNAPALIDEGRVTMEEVDAKVRRILRLMYRTNMLGDGCRARGRINSEDHHSVARRVAEQGIVLLKNEGGILPLNAAGKVSIAVIGANATHKHATSGGSSQVPALYEVTPLEGIRSYFGEHAQIDYVQGYEIKESAMATDAMIAEAVEAARTHDIVIFVGGYFHGYSDSWDDLAYDAESVDKPDMQLPFGQNQLIKAVAQANPRTVLVLYGGGASDMREWIDHVPAIVQAWYPGLEGGNALAAILAGEVNPSGKLPVTFPKRLEDSGAHALGEFPGGDTVNYGEGIFVGYRYNDTYGVEPQFPFGHGLSYTTFEYADSLVLGPANDHVAVRVQLRNSGDRAGAEVVQLYVGQENPSIERPKKELKAFQRVELAPGENKTVEFTLGREAFSAWHEGEGWVMEPGTYHIYVGSSSGDIRAQGEVQLKPFAE